MIHQPPRAPASGSALPPVHKPLTPELALADLSGKPFRLRQLKGRSTALWFFCGCPWCRDVAREWAQTLQNGTLEPPQGRLWPATVVVYAGDGKDLTNLLRETGLSAVKAPLIALPDPSGVLGERLYRTDPCPRALVLDGRGILRWINNHPDDQPRQISAATLVQKASAALLSASRR